MKLINLFTMVVLCVSQLHSMKASQPTPNENEGAPYFYQRRIPGATCPNLKIIASPDEHINSIANHCIRINGSTNRVVYGRFVVGGGPFTVVPHPDLRRSSLVTFTDGLIYQDGEILNTDQTIWALDCNGEFLIFPLHKANTLLEAVKTNRPLHVHLAMKDGNSMPLACAGEITVKTGKITYIDFSSGHYHPRSIQFALALSYFNEKNVVSDTVKLGWYEDVNFEDVHFESLAQVISVISAIKLG